MALLVPQNAPLDITVQEAGERKLRPPAAKCAQGEPMAHSSAQLIQAHASYALLAHIVSLVQLYAHTAAAEQAMVHLVPLHAQIAGQDNIALALHLLEQPTLAVLEARPPHQS